MSRSSDNHNDERSWLEAVHRTRYSNGIISLTEELLDPDRLARQGPFLPALHPPRKVPIDARNAVMGLASQTME